MSMTSSRASGVLVRTVILISAALLFSEPVRADVDRPQVRILYISSFESDSYDTATVIAALRQGLAFRGLRPEIYLASLDTYRLAQTEETRRLFDEILTERYGKIRFDVILAQASDALKAAARYRERLSYRPPVYCFDWIDPSLIERYSSIAGFYGRYLGMSFPPTLELAAALFPEAKKAYLLVSPINPEHIPNFLKDLETARRERPALELVPLLNTDFGTVERTLAGSAADSFALLLPGEWRLENGGYLGEQAALDKLAAVAALPCFGIKYDSFGSGLVGGAFTDREQMGFEAAEIVQDIIAGTPSLTAWEESEALVPTLDYRALQRFRVRRALIPPDARILHEPPGFWIRYEAQLKIVGAALMALSFTLIILGIVRRRERAILVRANESLEEMVARRTEELTAANTELVAANENLIRTMRELEEAEGRVMVSEKMAALGRLTANIGHELNTPLAAISSASNSMSEYLGESLGAVFREPLSLDSDMCGFFAEALGRASQNGRNLPWAGTEAERKARDQAEAVLKAAGFRDAYPIAEELAESGVADLAERAVPFLKGDDSETFIGILRATLGARRAAAIAEDAVAKAARVVASLRTYARSGEDDTQGSVLLAAVVREVLGFFDSQSLRECEVSIDIRESFAVHARRDDLVGIFFNLLKNAIQAARGSGRITVSAAASGGIARVTVADTGPGIPDEHKDRIFEPFFSTRPLGEGAGVGLDVSRRLARRNGGDIVFRSVPGETIFTVELRMGDSIGAEGTSGL
jgi:signal transduction histidine kinase